MAGQTTTASDLIVPEVWGPTAMNYIAGKTVLLPYVNTDTTLQGSPGERLFFPLWNYIGDADDLEEGVAMGTRRLSLFEGYATIKESGVAVELTDRAVLTSIGDPQGMAVQQLGLSVSRKLDTDIHAAATWEHTNAGADDDQVDSHPLKYDASGNAGAAANLNWDNIVEGIGVLGDEWDPTDWSALVINSAQRKDIMRDPNFIEAQKWGGADTPLRRGTIGVVGGVPVVVSDRNNNNGDGTYTSLLIKNNALTLVYKRQPIIEKDRDILRRTTVVTTNVHYAVRRTYDRGIVTITTKSGQVG